MKIEPVATAHANGRIERHVVLGYAAGPERLYNEAQLRQLGEACAQVAGPEDSYQDEWFNAKADAVNKINARIKELLS